MVAHLVLLTTPSVRCKYIMSISISGSSLTTGLNNTVQSPAYGSLSFNGLNQSIVTSGTGSGSAGTALDITTGTPSWTVECWVYTSQYSKVTAPQYFLNQSNGQTVAFRINSGTDKSYVTYGTNFLTVSFYSNVLGYVEMQSWPTTMSLNTWYHVALCKDTSNGERYYLYLNGVLVSSTPALSGIAGQNGPWEFGFPSSYITADPSYAFNGYLSNIRVVKGVAVYVPPDVAEPSLPLTSTQSLNLSGYTQAITGTQTSLLLNTSSETYNLGSSINFATSSAYVTYPSSSVYNFSTNNFTIEFWMNPSNVFINFGWSLWSIGSLTMASSNSGSSTPIDFYITDGLGHTIYTYKQAGQAIALYYPTAGVWAHLAIVRTGLGATDTKIYVNGILVTSGQMPSSLDLSSSQPTIGGGFQGSITNFRVTNGVAVYNANFYPPTTQLTSTQSANVNGSPSAAITGTETSLLLNATYGATFLADSSSNNFTPTLSSPAPTSSNSGPSGTYYLRDSSSYINSVTGVNNPTSSSMGPSTYSGSILFNGTNQYLTVPTAAQFNYSTNDFTWEMWVYPTSSTWTTDTMYFIDHGSAINQGTLHYYQNRLVYYNYYNAGNVPPYTASANYPSLFTIGGGPITANTWTHIAVSRQNLVTNMFVNGKVVSSGPDPYNYAALSGSPFSNPIVSPATQSVTIGARSDGAYLFKGNISNIRIVNGVSVYNVGNFTPPVQPLSPIQTSNQFGSPSKAIFGSQTSLLLNSPYSSSFLKDSSYNNVTVTQQTTGQYPPSTYTMTNNSTNPFNSNGSIFTPGSIYFNGTSQYLTVPANAVFAFGTGAFTVEAWVYLTSLQDILVFDTRTSAATTGIGFQINSSGVLCYIQATSTTLETRALTTSTWYHIAWVYDGTTVTGYVNGVAGTPSTVSLSLTQNNASIGRSGVSSASFMAGYLSNLRVIKDTAVYTQSFSPTTGPFTTSQTFNQSGIPSCPVQSSQTELLLNTPANTSFLTDSSTNAFTVTNNGTATSNPFNPFSENYTVLSNPGSVLLNGSTQYLTLPASTEFDYGTGDFTWECWIYPQGTNGSIIDFWISSPPLTVGQCQLFLESSTALLSFYYANTTTTLASITSASAITLNAWSHVAVVRSGSGTGNLKLYVNGIVAATSAGAVTQTIGINNLSGTIGRQTITGTLYYNGYVSNIRLVKGLAVYTSNFTPPAFPLNNTQAANVSGFPSAAVSSSQTSLMLNTAFGTNFLVDTSINNFTVTNNGTATSSASDPFGF